MSRGLGVLAVLLAACTAPTDPGALVVDRVDPASGPSAADTAVRIEGTNFSRPIRSSVDDGLTRISDFAISVGGVALANPSWRDEGLLEGTVPAGLAPGTYDVTVQIGKRSDVLVGGYTVFGPGGPGAPSRVYASATDGELWGMNPETMQTQQIGVIRDPDNMSPLSVDAMAVDVDGTIVGVTAAPYVLVRIDPSNATVTSKVAVSADHTYWGATMAPAGTFAVDPTLLIAANDTGNLYRIAPDGTVTLIGSFGGDFRVAGDLAYVSGVGLFASVTGTGCAGTCIAAIADNGAATLLSGTAPGDLWGLAAFNGKLYALGGDSRVHEVDTTTGAMQTAFTSPIVDISDAAP